MIELRLLAGWLCALVGNRAFRLGDSPATAIHFSTAARLGTLRVRLHDLDHDLFIAADPAAEPVNACTRDSPHPGRPRQRRTEGPVTPADTT